MSLTLFYHPVFLLHITGLHPESPERLRSTRVFLEDHNLLDKLKEVEPHCATEEELRLVHTANHIEEVRKLARKGGGYIDSDTILSSSSYKAAVFACGAAIDAVEEVLTNQQDVFCLIRPPGHHALADKAMGFCLFNNLAIAASYAIKKKGISRILIVDWDAHHGNGLQDIFYETDRVLYISLHQMPLYPGTGTIEEVGKGKGEGFTINIPFPSGTAESTYLKAFYEIILPVAEQFEPEMVMIAAGYDSHCRDPLASVCLTANSYAKMTAMLKSISHSPFVLTLEGGYQLEALSRSVAATIAEVASIKFELNEEPVIAGEQRYGLESIVRIKKVQQRYWSLKLG